jgi:uncharacterized membrane protein YhhN
MAGQLIAQPLVIVATKPFLMPVLAWWLYREAGAGHKALVLTYVALSFATIGDSLLLGATHAASPFFPAGIGAFLVTQIAYIFAFVGMAGGQFAPFRTHRVGGALLLMWYLAFTLLLLPGIEGWLRYAVSLYGFALTWMCLSALNLYGRPYFRSVFTGALLFLISDSLIALDRFYVPIPWSGVWIMATYLSGQYLIIRGIADWARDQRVVAN